MVVHVTAPSAERRLVGDEIRSRQMTCKVGLRNSVFGVEIMKSLEDMIVMLMRK